ncbi:hypothetical protein [Azovibrio restrictus]|uniref:hypothetical protein n=1 Tax=Azovibrio restrictus TaxID=146938 RepID=UPI0026ECC494|nr:hypothetical protein [Azovibrio restrictus]MDD3483170.1 hypothetical protein [Azovibrio restrictus]
MKQREAIFDPEKVSDNEIYKFLTTHWQHQNQLSWSRLYVMVALELATLGGAFSIKGILGVSAIVVGTFVGFLLYRLILRDWHVRDQHQELIEKVHKSSDIRMVPEPGSRWNHGRFLLRNLFTTLFLTNIATSLIFLYPSNFQPVSTNAINNCANNMLQRDALPQSGSRP